MSEPRKTTTKRVKAKWVEIEIIGTSVAGGTSMADVLAQCIALGLEGKSARLKLPAMCATVTVTK